MTTTFARFADILAKFLIEHDFAGHLECFGHEENRGEDGIAWCHLYSTPDTMEDELEAAESQLVDAAEQFVTYEAEHPYEDGPEWDEDIWHAGLAPIKASLRQAAIDYSYAQLNHAWALMVCAIEEAEWDWDTFQ